MPNLPASLIFRHYHNEAPPDALVAPLQSLYNASFPVEERGPFYWLVDSPANGSGVLFTLHDGPELMGFAYTYLLPDTRTAFLGYICVQPGSRSSGLGGALLDYAACVTAQMQYNGLLYEVEAPEEAAGEERALRERRIGFYQRHGAIVIDDGGLYRIPLMTGEGSMAMRLMWLPARPGCPPPLLPDLRALFIYLYHHAYSLPSDNPLLLSLLEKLPAAPGQDTKGE